MADRTRQPRLIVILLTSWLLQSAALVAAVRGRDVPPDKPPDTGGGGKDNKSDWISQVIEYPEALRDVRDPNPDELQPLLELDDEQNDKDIAEQPSLRSKQAVIREDENGQGYSASRDHNVRTQKSLYSKLDRAAESLKLFQRLLHMPSISHLANQMSPSTHEVASEYMRALYYTVRSVIKPVQVVSKDLTNEGDKEEEEEEVVWGIKAFHVRHRRGEFTEAFFHVALEYDPAIIVKVELVLENKLPPRYVRKAERASRPRQPRYSLETCNPKEDYNREAHFAEKKLKNSAARPQTSVAFGYPTDTMPEGSPNKSVEEFYSNISETEIDDVEIKNKDDIPVTEKSTSDDTGEDTRRRSNQNALVNKSHADGTRPSTADALWHVPSVAAAVNRSLSAEKTTEPKCYQQLNIRRRRLVGQTHEVEVFDITRSLMSWWADCNSQHNIGSHINDSFPCTAMVRFVRAQQPPMKQAEFQGNALLIIYKNVAADLVRTRRALKHGLASRATVPRRSMTKRNYGGDITDGINDTKYKRNVRHSSSAVKETRDLKYNGKPSDADDVSSSLCRLHKWHINFEEMGWLWVIAPMSFDANYCAGSCEVGINDLDRLSFTNNAFLRNAYHLFNVNRAVPAPSCVPVRTGAMNILYRSDDETIVLRRVSEITAERCGCL